MKQLKLLLPLVLVAVFFQACNDEDNDPIVVSEQSITGVAARNADLSNLVAALTKTGLDQVLAGAGEFTVLAPNNAAFASFLAANNFNTLDDVPTDLLRNVLLNHVISGRLQSGDLSTGFANTLAETSSGAQMSIYINTAGGVTFNGISSVSQANVNTANGVIHLVDAVIGLPTVVDLAAAAGATSSLVAAVAAADLVDTLSGTGPFTVLAPTNDAFADFLAANNFSGLGDIPTAALTQVLLNHVVGGALQSTDLSTGYASTSATSMASGTPVSIYINTDNGVRFNGVSSVSTANINANNGVIHLIDAVIGLPTVVDFALADPNFSTLVSALTRPDLTTDFVSILSTPDGTAPAPFTVFAPINDAFAGLLTELNLNGLGDIDEPTLNATLTFHVVGGANVRSNNLTDNFTVPTLGGDIKADVTGGAKLTDGNNREIDIVAFDVQANNGVIHAIDRVILPN